MSPGSSLPIQATASVRLTPKVRELILRHEGLNQPGDVPPLDSSGVTIGYGYDLGYSTAQRFGIDWAGVELKPEHLRRLAAVCGLTGPAARIAAARLKDIRITPGQALPVFLGKSWPAHAAMAITAFPGLAQLPDDAQGALVSLIYNRGPSMGIPGRPSWERRREMRAIREAVARGDLREIAAQLRQMKRLWADSEAPGLLTRREDEARLVEEAAAC